MNGWKALAGTMPFFGLEPRYAPTSMGRMHYFDSHPGSRKRPLVLIHGLGRDGTQLAPVALTTGRRVVLPDLFGFSGQSLTDRAMRVGDHAQSVRELMRELRCDRADLVGVSLGGWIALRLAGEDTAGLVDSLFLVNPAGINVGAEDLRELFRNLDLENFDKLYLRIVQGRPFTGVPVVSDVIRRGFFASVGSDSVRDFIHTVQESDFVDPLLAKIQCRTFLLCATNDLLLTRETARTLLGGIPIVDGKWVEGASHNMGYEAFANLCLELRHFLGIDNKSLPPLLRWALRLRSPLRVTSMRDEAHV